MDLAKILKITYSLLDKYLVNIVSSNYTLTSSSNLLLLVSEHLLLF